MVWLPFPRLPLRLARLDMVVSGAGLGIVGAVSRCWEPLLNLARFDMLVSGFGLCCVCGLCLIRRRVLVPLAGCLQVGSGLRAEVHLKMLGGFLGQFGLLLLVGPRPSGARLSGVRVPDLCRGRLRAPC